MDRLLEATYRAEQIVNVAALSVLRGNHSLFGSEVRRSTRRRLRRVLTHAGFEIMRLTYTNFTLFPLMLAVRRRSGSSASRRRTKPDIPVPSAPVTAVLSALL